MIQSFYGSQAFPPKYNSPHRVREFKTVLDSGFHTMDSGFQIPDSSLCRPELGLWIPIFCGIPDSLSCILDSGFQSLGFQVPQPKYSLIPDSTNKKFPRFRNPDFSTCKSGIRSTPKNVCIDRRLIMKVLFSTFWRLELRFTAILSKQMFSDKFPLFFKPLKVALVLLASTIG